MTNDSKDKLLKYISGNLANETGNNVPYGTIGTTINATLWDDLTTAFTTYTLAKIITNSTNTMLIAYGDYDGTAKGFIALATLDFQTIEIITQNSLGTDLGRMEYLNYDENGMFYGVDYLVGTGGRFLLFNNFTIPNSDGEYQVILRKSYISPNDPVLAQNQDLVHCTWLKGSSITKKTGESKYIMLSTIDQENSQILLTELTIIIGEPVVWNYIVLISTPFNFGTTMFQDSYCEFGEDTYTVKFNALFNSGGTYTYREYTSIDGAVVTTYISSTTIAGPRSAIITSLTQSYFCFNDGTYFDIYSNVSEIDTRIYHQQDFSPPAYADYFTLSKQIGEVFFYHWSSNEDGPFNNTIGQVINNIGIQIYISTIGFDRAWDDILFVSKQYNLYNYFLYIQGTNEVINIQEVYNPSNYNGQPYENENSLMPNNAILKNSSDDLLFARNLYNLSLSNNVSVATVQVPNNYLNEDVIAKEDLISKTNIELVNGTTTITKNIYETLLINFISTLYMKDDNIPATPKYNLIGASKVTEGINTADEYTNTQIGKLRVTYSDLTTAIFDITDITIVGTTATININFYVYKIITKIEILSADETTVYLSKDITQSNINKLVSGTTITITDAINTNGKITAFECASTQNTVDINRNIFKYTLLTNKTLNGDEISLTIPAIYDHLIAKGGLGLLTNTIYTMTILITQNTSNVDLTLQSGATSSFSTAITIPAGSTTTITRTMTTKSDFTNVLYDVWFTHANTGTGLLKIKIMLELGSVARTYIAWNTPIPIYSTGDGGILNLWSHKKNMFDKTTAVSGFINSSGGISASALSSSSPYISVNSSTNYYISGFRDSIPRSNAFYDINKNFISLASNNLGGLTAIPSNCRYLRICFANADLNVIQLEQGTVATPYEAYTGADYPITLPVGYVGGSLPNGVKDTDAVKNVGKVILTGSEAWVLVSTQTNTIQFAYTIPLEKTNIPNTNSSIVFRCDKFKVTNSTDGTDTEHIRTSDSPFTSSKRVYILKSRLATQDLIGFKTWLASNNVTVQYQLATPVAITTTLPQIQTYVDYTVVDTTNTVKPFIYAIYTSIETAEMQINKTYNIKQDIQII